jgi:hypothetical protein
MEASSPAKRGESKAQEANPLEEQPLPGRACVRETHSVSNRGTSFCRATAAGLLPSGIFWESALFTLKRMPLTTAITRVWLNAPHVGIGMALRTSQSRLQSLQSLWGQKAPALIAGEQQFVLASRRIPMRAR